MMPPRVLASGPKPCGGNYAETKLHSESVKVIEVQKDKIKIER